MRFAALRTRISRSFTLAAGAGTAFASLARGPSAACPVTPGGPVRTRSAPMMFSERFQAGDLVYAQHDLVSDGLVPDTQAGEVLVPHGARGMVIQVGNLEDHPEISVYMVRFEGADGDLGPALGCLTEELTQREELLPKPAAVEAQP
jgi:nitrogen fixation protein NifZ